MRHDNFVMIGIGAGDPTAVMPRALRAALAEMRALNQARSAPNTADHDNPALLEKWKPHRMPAGGGLSGPPFRPEATKPKAREPKPDFMATARALAKREKIRLADAMGKVARRDPDLYRQHRAEANKVHDLNERIRQIEREIVSIRRRAELRRNTRTR